MREHVVATDGTRIGWERVGEGPPVVVLHGGGRAGKHYRALADVLAPRFSVLLVDRRGRGDSGPGGVEHALEEEIGDLQAVFRATGATRLFGHSAGGAISLAAAGALPLSHLALYEPPVLIEELLPLDWVPTFQQDGSISCPTLLLGGVASPPYLHEMVARLGAALPNVRRVDLPGVGHNAPDMEAPARVGEELLAFFA